MRAGSGFPGAAAAPERAWTGRRGTAWIRLLRPRHWAKNAFVLAPLLFSSSFLAPAMWPPALAATALFCVAASLVYVVNDWADMASDRRHPTKRHDRPLAAGEVLPGEAAVLAAGLAAVLVAAAPLAPAVAAGLAAYVALHLAYSAGLKRVAGVESACIAAGFVARTWVGAAAIGVPLSGWMAGTTFLLTFHLAALKRYHERRAHGAACREVLARYSERGLAVTAATTGLAAIAGYAWFATQVRPEFAWSVGPAAIGMARYAWLVHADRAGETPVDAVAGDVALATAVGTWCACAVAALWP